MGVVAPIVAAGVVLPVVVGIGSGHHLAAWQLAGIVAAVTGVVLCSTAVSDEEGTAPSSARRAASYGLGAALCFGIELALLNRLSGSTDESASMLVVRLAALGVLAAALGARALRTRTTAATRSDPVRPTGWYASVVLAAGVADVAAMTLFVRSGDDTALPVVAVLASLYPAVTVGLGRLLAGDRVQRSQRLGLVAVVLGASLVAVP